MPHFIFIQQISVLNILNMLYNLHFFSSKCCLLHNATLFCFCITHILNTECAKIWKKKSVAKRLIIQFYTLQASPAHHQKCIVALDNRLTQLSFTVPSSTVVNSSICSEPTQTDRLLQFLCTDHSAMKSDADELTTVLLLYIEDDNHMHGMENLTVWLGLTAEVRVFENRSV